MWSLISLVAGVVLGGTVAMLYWARRVRVSIARVHSAQKRARGAERLAEIGSMTGGLAHEIKNPLSTIGLNAQLLTEAIEDLPIESGEKTRLVRRMEALGRETDRLRGILEDFLEYAGELRLNIAPAHLNTIVEELADFFSPMASGAGVRLRVEPDPADPVAPVDADHLKQALLNLMLNAVHAMETHGGDPKELILRVRGGIDEHDQRVVRVHVIDTGPGIDERTREKIFHPYFSTKSSGNGLGLPTARRIIDAHQGHIDLHSEPGRGSSFVITLAVEVADDQDKD